MTTVFCGRRILLGIILAIVAALLFALPTTASAIEVLDQEVSDDTNDFYTDLLLNLSAEIPAQVFTVGVTGELSRIELFIDPYCLVADSYLKLDIMELDSDGKPNGQIIQTAYVLAPSNPQLSLYWVSFELNPMQVTTGDMFGFVYTTADGSENNCRGDIRIADPSQGDGTAWFLAHGTWYELPGFDWYYKTYVNVDSTPGTTDPGTDVEVVPDAVDENGDPIGESPVSFQFDEVTGGGETTVTVSSTGTPPPNGFRIGNPPTYFELETTATFSGSVEVCINYGGVSYGNENALALLHNEGGIWVDITSSLDTDADVICGVTDSFSEFAVMEELTPQELLAALESATRSINAKNGVVNSLDGKLNAVRNALNDTNENNDGAAVNALEAFISTTQSQADKGTISPEDAAALIGAAEEIISVLS